MVPAFLLCVQYIFWKCLQWYWWWRSLFYVQYLTLFHHIRDQLFKRCSYSSFVITGTQAKDNAVCFRHRRERRGWPLNIAMVTTTLAIDSGQAGPNTCAATIIHPTRAARREIREAVKQWNTVCIVMIQLIVVLQMFCCFSHFTWRLRLEPDTQRGVSDPWTPPISFLHTECQVYKTCWYDS